LALKPLLFHSPRTANLAGLVGLKNSSAPIAVIGLPQDFLIGRRRDEIGRVVKTAEAPSRSKKVPTVFADFQPSRSLSTVYLGHRSRLYAVEYGVIPRTRSVTRGTIPDLSDEPNGTRTTPLSGRIVAPLERGLKRSTEHIGFNLDAIPNRELARFRPVRNMIRRVAFRNRTEQDRKNLRTIDEATFVRGGYSRTLNAAQTQFYSGALLNAIKVKGTIGSVSVSQSATGYLGAFPQAERSTLRQSRHRLEGLRYVRQSDRRVDVVKLEETVRRKVEETVEKKVTQRVEGWVARELSLDSIYTRRLEEKIQLELRDSLVLERERLG
jgi:hypothetical protein